MKLRQGPQLHKACSVREGGYHGCGSGAREHHRVVCLLVAIKWDQFQPLRRAHQRLRIMTCTSTHLSAHPMTRTRPICQRVQLTGNVTVKESDHKSDLNSATTTFSVRLVKTVTQQKFLSLSLKNTHTKTHTHTHTHRPFHRPYLCNNEEVIARFSLHHYLLSIFKLNGLQSVSHRQTFPLIQRLCEQKTHMLPFNQAVQYRSIPYNIPPNDKQQIWLAFPPSTVPLLRRRGIFPMAIATSAMQVSQQQDTVQPVNKFREQ